MAKGALKKVAQRLVTSHYHRHYLTQRAQLSTSNGAVATPTDQHGTQSGDETYGSCFTLVPSSNQPYGVSGEEGLSSWTNNPENSLEATIETLKDDEEIRRDLMVNGNNLPFPRLTSRTDTHAMVKGLMAGGFTLTQAEALTMTIVDMATQNTDGWRESMVSKAQAELTVQKIASQLAILRRDMMIMEKTDFTELITKIERITHELEQLQKTSRDEIRKIGSDLTLDFNLEKGHMKDMHLDHLKAVEDKHGRIYEQLHSLDKELQNIRSYINTENAALQTTFERYKSDTIKLGFGAVATCMTIVLGFYRLWS